jgi:hypothetical protein
VMMGNARAADSAAAMRAPRAPRPTR